MLTVAALVPKKFVSKMKKKQEKKNTPVAQETLTMSLGPFFCLVSLVLISHCSRAFHMPTSCVRAPHIPFGWGGGAGMRHCKK
jgi:hypothetical protein